jgi:hypothetical protein
MPRITTWKIPLALGLTGLILTVALGILVGRTIGTWVGWTFGFLAFVTAMLWVGGERPRAVVQEPAAEAPRPDSVDAVARPPWGRPNLPDVLAGTSIWTRLAFVAALVGPWSFTISLAMFGEHSPPSMLLSNLIVVIAMFYGDRAFLRLPGAARRRVIEVQRSGRPSGDHELDLIALDRLRSAALAAPAHRILTQTVVAVLLVGYVALPVTAAVHGSGWWLLTLLPAALVGVALLAGGTSADRRGRLDRLLQALEA